MKGDALNWTLHEHSLSNLALQTSLLGAVRHLLEKLPSISWGHHRQASPRFIPKPQWTVWPRFGHLIPNTVSCGLGTTSQVKLGVGGPFFDEGVSQADTSTVLYLYKHHTVIQ